MKVSDLRGILTYVPRFREKIFVVAIDGEVAASPNFSNILLDLAVLRSLSVKIIVVHGAALQIERLAAERGVTTSNCDGTGITDEPTLKVALDAATTLMNDIMQGLTSVDLRATYANIIIAHPAGIIGGLDHQHTGKVERVDREALTLFLNAGIIPVIPPIGFDGEGRTFRVNSDTIALEVAEAMQAMKIIYLSARDGVVLSGSLVHQLSISEADEMVKKKRALLDRNTLSKVEAGARACRNGVPRVHIINGNADEALLAEVFSPEGVGTMIYGNDYQQIRRVFKKDIRAVLELIKQSVEHAELVKRTRADILAQLDDYWVLEIDRQLVACVAVHFYPEAHKAELACLYVSKHHEGQGFGRKLMAFAEQLAAQRGSKHLFALSTQTFNYFVSKGGYAEVSPDELPAERRKKYDLSGRNSKVLQKAVIAAGTEATRA
ncbi:MAG: Amino-acid acetyltransferase [Verrucomicrobiota bacterium]|jgi:amino-acid N-acetyltransferase